MNTIIRVLVWKLVHLFIDMWSLKKYGRRV